MTRHGAVVPGPGIALALFFYNQLTFRLISIGSQREYIESNSSCHFSIRLTPINAVQQKERRRAAIFHDQTRNV